MIKEQKDSKTVLADETNEVEIKPLNDYEEILMSEISDKFRVSRDER